MGSFGYTDFSPASSGVLSPFLQLHFEQHVTILDHVFCPPFDLGITLDKAFDAEEKIRERYATEDDFKALKKGNKLFAKAKNNIL